ncbi:MAG TPA: pilus assembly protein TadG-related protein [Terriglobales bacterium]|nr:pilus assembly protein TadG-related protein [Terriglobales bacterium]
MKLPPKRICRAEQGQTILLVAVSIVALLSMAALAIDVVTLYVAKSEIQRAADAIALAGAKAIADSGVTTVPIGDPSLTAAETLAGTMSSAAITAALSANTVNGSPPALVGGTPTPNWSKGNNNPYITVTVQQTNLPTFFAKIWARATASTQATATAEAYNPANMEEFTPVTPQCVKPMLMANANPYNPLGIGPGAPLGQLIDPTTGDLVPAAADIIGSNIYLTSDCNSSASNCTALHFSPENFQPGAGPPTYPAVYFVPATVAPTNVIASTCSNAASLSEYGQVIAGCDQTPYAWTQCGGTTNSLLWDTGPNPDQETQGLTGTDTHSDTAQGAECLLGVASPNGTGPEGSRLGLDQDTLNYPGGWPTGPPTITVNRAPQNGSVVSTSNSIVTIPIIANQPLSQINREVTVVGFLQGFINFVGYDTGVGSPNANYGDLNITVMNVVGCSQTTNGNPPVVGGNGVSTIPIRLITTPTT